MSQTHRLLLRMSAALVLLAFAWPSAVSGQALRPVVVISDLHMGLGRDTAGRWVCREDFRWPVALRAFLDQVSADGGRQVDLVIAGDFLELWQGAIPCPGTDADQPKGPSTVAEMVEFAKQVVAAHPQELPSFSRFAATGANCVTVVPGNHDAALLIDRVWEPVRAAMAASGGCVRRADDGRWKSANGLVMVEHGQQIGEDANKYPAWPSITHRVGDAEYLLQPWGESFVQAIFNVEEGRYPLIDNLSPMTAGVRYRMADRGIVGTAADVARLLRFNLSETSLRQKRQILGAPPADGKRSWDRRKARAFGYRLFLHALPADDPFRASLQSGGGSWADTRAALDASAGELTDNEVDSLCDQLAIRKAAIHCEPSTLGAGYEAILYSRQQVLESHLLSMRQAGSTVAAFVYGHTHSFETPWRVTFRPPGRLRTSVEVANSGAFQRLVDDDRLVALAKAARLSPAEFLRERSPESLPACYTSVHVSWRNGRPALATRAWLMDESDSKGQFVDPCGRYCPTLGHGCNR